MSTLISKAIAVAGSQKKLAEACGVSQAAVSKWLMGGGVSAESALAIERATDGSVRAEDLRPDVFRAFVGSRPAA